MFNSISIKSAIEIDNLNILLLSIFLAFVLSTILAFAYQKTFRGLSYSRNYVQSIVLISIISATVIQAVGDSLSRGIGIMAAMSIIRFRTNFKDPRDTLFLFASLAAGISCGAYAFQIAIVGTLGFSLAAIVLFYSSFGPTNYFDGMLRFNVEASFKEQPVLEKIMHDYCKSFALVTIREIGQGHRLDYAYHVKLRKGKSYESLMTELQTIQELQGLSLMMQDSTVDI